MGHHQELKCQEDNHSKTLKLENFAISKKIREITLTQGSHHPKIGRAHLPTNSTREEEKVKDTFLIKEATVTPDLLSTADKIDQWIATTLSSHAQAD